MSEVTKALLEKAPRLVLGTGEAAVELLRMEAGTFLMGATASEAGHQPEEAPAFRVKLTRAFYLGRFPITQQQYQAVTKKSPARAHQPNQAMDQLTYADAVEFCRLFSQVCGLSVTLPTEAQWEYACRAGTTTRFWNGDSEDDLARVGWYRANSGLTVHAVGQRPANPWGLHDMHGNVCEFCLDVLPSYDSLPKEDPVGRVNNKEGMMRGGAWMYPADYCRAATRLLSNERFGGAGLRIALAVP